MSDFSIYPNAIDGLSQLPVVVDGVTRIDAVTVNRLREAIINIETELGITPSSDNYDSVRARLDAMELDMASLFLRLSTHKNPVTVATTENVDLDNPPTVVDGVTLSQGDRVLVHLQNDASENGIYLVTSTGEWVRANDADDEDSLLPGTEVYVIKGNSYATVKFWLTTVGPYVIGDTSLQFIEGLSIMRSDSEPTQILTAQAIGASSAAATETDSIGVRGFSEIDFSFSVSNLGAGPITEVRARVLYSLLASPDAYGTTPSHWNILLAENIDAGISTSDPYTLSLTVASYPLLGSLPGSFAIRAPVSGLNMMVLIWAEAGSPTSSSFAGYALRRY